MKRNGEMEGVNTMANGLTKPVSVYNNWAAYDELSDSIPLTEELAMRQLDEILRLRKAGVQFDYYLMDAFWFSQELDYRQWRKPHWPAGPNRWFTRCEENRLKPGLWVATNSAGMGPPPAAWKDSFDAKSRAYCMFEGGFLAGFMDVLQHWADRGVRMFKFDFARMWAATETARKRYKPGEIAAMNADALRTALTAFRKRNPGVLFSAFNGFGGEMRSTAIPVKQTVDLRWLEAFDALYCGDPRPSDVPTMNFWRSMDIYTDHMVRYYELNKVPLKRIDNTGFMIGTTGTCYKRGLHAWKGMLLLLLARGGWMNVYYGNLDLLEEGDAEWFAKAQALFLALQSSARIFTFGGLPGEARPYGFAAVTDRGSVFTVVNPSQSVQATTLPEYDASRGSVNEGRILFSDAGFHPSMEGSAVRLGPEQMAVVGFGEYADVCHDLGIQEDVVIPKSIRKIEAVFEDDGQNAVTSTLRVPDEGDIRIVMQQYVDGTPHRSTGGPLPKGTTMGTVLQTRVEQAGRSLPVEVHYDKVIWSGLSWAAGEIRKEAIRLEEPLTIRCASTEEKPVEIRADVYRVTY